MKKWKTALLTVYRVTVLILVCFTVWQLGFLKNVSCLLSDKGCTPMFKKTTKDLSVIAAYSSQEAADNAENAYDRADECASYHD